jgi:hypothetical protein
MDDATMRLGLLMEAAQAQQKASEVAVEQLATLSREIDNLVREELRRAFAEEFQALGLAGRRATEALHAVRRAASLRIASWSVAVAGICSMIPVAVAWSVLPSRSELVRLRAERDQLVSSVGRLQQYGALIDLRRCGAASRLCVRIDRKAPTYGEQSDYFVLKGY